MITKKTIIADVLLQYSEAAEIFAKYGMNCTTCPYRWEETMEVGAGCHNANLMNMLKELNDLE